MGDDRKEVEWDDDFAPRETRRFRWDLIADQLRQRPGRWAKVVGSGGRAADAARCRRARVTVPGPDAGGPVAGRDQAR